MTEEEELQEEQGQHTTVFNSADHQLPIIKIEFQELITTDEFAKRQVSLTASAHNAVDTQALMDWTIAKYLGLREYETKGGADGSS